MILEIDAGNTSLKWRWRGSAANSVRGPAQLESELAHASRPEEVLVCNVRGAELKADLAAWTARKWDLQPRFARVARVCGGVRIQYPDPSRLGADRWLAMLAGYRRANGNCLIVDSGTALTIDVIDDGGLHLGGYIMPGLQTLRSSLLRNTEIRLTPGNGEESVALGNDTGDAVRNGTLFMLCGAVRAALERFEREMSRLRRGKGRPRREHESPMLVLTGGDAALLKRELGREGVPVVPDLVLDGLEIACAHPEE